MASSGCTWRDRCHRRGCTSPKFSANRSHLANPHSTLCLRATPAADPYRLGHCHDTEFASRFTVIFGAITLGLVFFSSRQSSEGAYFRGQNPIDDLAYRSARALEARAAIRYHRRCCTPLKLSPNHSHPPKKPSDALLARALVIRNRRL